MTTDTLELSHLQQRLLAHWQALPRSRRGKFVIALPLHAAVLLIEAINASLTPETKNKPWWMDRQAIQERKAHAKSRKRSRKRMAATQTS